MLCTPPGIQVARLPKACYNTEAGATSGIRILLLVTARRCIVPLPGTFFDGLRETPKQLILQTERRVQPRALHDTSYFSFDGFERLAEAPSAGNS